MAHEPLIAMLVPSDLHLRRLEADVAVLLATVFGFATVGSLLSFDFPPILLQLLAAVIFQTLAAKARLILLPTGVLACELPLVKSFLHTVRILLLALCAPHVIVLLLLLAGLTLLGDLLLLFLARLALFELFFLLFLLFLHLLLLIFIPLLVLFLLTALRLGRS